MSEQEHQPEEKDVQAQSHEPAILQVKPHEELGSLLQRLRGESASQIRLVVPDRAIITQGGIAMKLLADVAGKLQKEISIVSDSPQVQKIAKRAGLNFEGVEAGDEHGHGFVPGADVALLPVVNETKPVEEEMVVNNPYEQVDEMEPESETATGSGGIGAIFGKAQLANWFKGNKAMLTVVAVFLLVGVGGFLMATYYLPQATVTLYTQKRTIDRDLQVTADPAATAVDKENMVIPATVVSAESSQTKTFDATGEEEVGEKATGIITILNNSEDEKELPAGTVVSSDGKQFTLSNSVTVPAKKDGIFVINPEKGTADVAVAAVDIGPEYNLEAESQFSVGGFEMSTLAGINEDAFTGGSKETITVVTADDRQQALESLAQTTQEAAMSELKKKISSGQLLLDDAATPETKSTEFSHEAGAEVDEFSLTVTAAASAPVINQSDLESLLTGAIEAKVPDGYVLSDGAPEIENNVIQVEDSGVLRLTSTFKAQVVPVVETEELVDAIKGKHPSAVENYLKDQPNLNGYDITLTPQLPGPFYRLPRIESKIEVTVEVKD